MDLASIVFMSLIVANAAMILFWKIGFERVLRYEVLVDVATTVLLTWLCAGSTAGMMIGIFSGLIVSLELRAVRHYGGYRIERTVRKWWFDKVKVVHG